MAPSSKRLRSGIAACAFSLPAIAGCASDPAVFNVAFAGDRTSVPNASVSVIGVYRDGRMDVGTWPDIAPTLMGSLHLGDCAAWYGERLVQTDPRLAATVDEVSREIGVTDELLQKIAPAASGDVLFVVRISGKLPEKKEPTNAPTGAPPMGVGTRGSRQQARARPSRELEPGDKLEITASLFSLAEKKTIAVLSVKYAGASVDDALHRFGERLATVMPNARCGGFRDAVAIDPGSLRSLSSPGSPR